GTSLLRSGTWLIAS
ncbi:unnamed protein product, partial [Allacma fusca]